MRFFAILITCLLWFNINFAQIGQPFIVNFSPEQYRGEGQIWAITQDENGLMYFGGNSGMYYYDGETWETYDFGHAQNFVVRSLGVIGDTLVYGSVGSLGFLLPQAVGFRQIDLALELDSVTSHALADVWDVAVAGDVAVFSSDTMIFRYNPHFDPKFKLLFSHPAGFTFLSEVDGKVYFSTYRRLYRYDPETDMLDSFKTGQIMPWHFLPYKGDTLFLMSHQGFFLFDFGSGKLLKDKTFDRAAKVILPEFPYNMEYLPKYGVYVFATIKNGIYFVDHQGNIIKTLDKSKGLASQTIQSLYVDKSGNLWAGTSSGISLMNLSLPFEVFDERNGLEGVPYSALLLDSTWLMGTNTDFFTYNQNTQKFVQVNTEDGLGIQQVFLIDTVRFSDNTVHILTMANSGLFEYKDGSLELVSRNGSYSFHHSKLYGDTIYEIRKYDLYAIPYNKGKFEESRKRYSFDDFYRLLGFDKQGRLWLLSQLDDKLSYFDLKENKVHIVGKNIVINGTLDLDGKYIFTSEGGLYEFDAERDTLVVSDIDLNKYLRGKDVIVLDKINDSVYIAVINKKLSTSIYEFRRRSGELTVDSNIFEILPKVTDFYHDKNQVLFVTDQGFIKYRLEYDFDPAPRCKPIIRKITIDDDSVVYNSTTADFDSVFRFPYKYNSLIIEYAMPSYFAGKPVEFSYYLEGGRQKKWSDWSTDYKKEFSNLREGTYVFHLRARNQFMKQTREISFSFRIYPPWYRTIGAYIIYVLLAGLIIWGIVKLNERRLRLENERLEQIIKMRTAEIEQQKEELKAQAENLREVNQLLVEKNEEIRQILESLKEANKKISDQNNHIRSSIEYAQKIQKAIISRQNLFQLFFDEYFVFFRPKEIVSGDFYWTDYIDGRLYVAVADCTGHGVPGAFMSMLSYALLSQIVAKSKNLTTADILELLRKEIIKIMVSKESNNIIHRDGLDISLVAIDYEKKQIQFSGAYNPLVIIRDGELMEIKAVKASIGYSRKLKPFKVENIDIKEGDKVYMFTDGYLDQYGGNNNTKFFRRNFYKLLLDISGYPMERQREILEQVFDDWKNGHIQIDDVTVVGFKISIKRFSS